MRCPPRKGHSTSALRYEWGLGQQLLSQSSFANRVVPTAVILIIVILATNAFQRITLLSRHTSTCILSDFSPDPPVRWAFLPPGARRGTGVWRDWLTAASAAELCFESGVPFLTAHSLPQSEPLRSQSCADQTQDIIWSSNSAPVQWSEMAWLCNQTWVQIPAQPHTRK